MLEKMTEYFKDECALQNISYITQYIEYIEELLDEQYLHEKAHKNDAIDAVCEILKKRKTTPTQDLHHPDHE